MVPWTVLKNFYQLTPSAELTLPKLTSSWTWETVCVGVGRMRWPKYWSFSLGIIPSKEIPRLIAFRMDWLDLLAVQGTLKSLLQHHSSKAHSRLPRGVRPRLEGKPRTPLSSRVATRVSWSPLSGLKGGISGKEPACQCKRYKRCWFDSWVWKIPWRKA